MKNINQNSFFFILKFFLKNILNAAYLYPFYPYQKVHLLGIRNTMKEHASKGIKNIFDTLQKANIPFDVFLL
ncbi:hypothetical protein I2750_21310 [Bacillus sp. PR5]|nr:hypothetical protein [Bacillus sp. PR5]